MFGCQTDRGYSHDSFVDKTPEWQRREFFLNHHSSFSPRESRNVPAISYRGSFLGFSTTNYSCQHQTATTSTTGIKVASKQEKYAKIRDKKKQIPIESLCRHCPPQFSSYLTYTRKLKFEDRPDYAALRRIFRDILMSDQWCPLQPAEDPNMFDWEKVGRSSERSVVSAAAGRGPKSDWEKVGGSERSVASSAAGRGPKSVFAKEKVE